MSIGLAILAVVGVASICAVFSVVSSMRTPSPAYTSYAPPAPVEPFRGATSAFGTLGSRDSTRALLGSGTALARDPLGARTALETTLRDRGYVVGTTAESPASPLPFDAPAPDLEGACGVVLVTGDGATTITRAGTGGTTFASVDPSAFTVALCGPGNVHVEGVGHASLRTWLFAGLTPAAMTSTGVSADALLAHAEAERMLRRRGYVPIDELIEVVPTVATAGGIITLHLPTTPAAGCIPFVAYIEGAGRPQLPIGRFDFLEDRALSGAVACAVTSRNWEPMYVDDTTLGARVLLRAYGAAPAGIPTGTPIVSIADAHLVDAAHASRPSEIASP